MWKLPTYAYKLLWLVWIFFIAVRHTDWLPTNFTHKVLVGDCPISVSFPPDLSLLVSFPKLDTFFLLRITSS